MYTHIIQLIQAIIFGCPTLFLYPDALLHFTRYTYMAYTTCIGTIGTNSIYRRLHVVKAAITCLGILVTYTHSRAYPDIVPRDLTTTTVILQVRTRS